MLKNTMDRVFYLIRGLPGSGKSTLARTLSHDHRAYHYEADMYFVNDMGQYKFDAARIGAAHEWCFRNFENCIYADSSVVVSNTFTTMKEMDEYIELALKFGYKVRIIECTGNYGSVHGVPEKTFEKMKARFVHNDKLREAVCLLNDCKNVEFETHV